MSRYRLTREGNYAWEGEDALVVINHMASHIKQDWDKGWVLEDTQATPDQHCSVWTVHWSHAYNGVELSPLVGTR